MESEAPGGDDFLLKIPGGGGGLPGRWERRGKGPGGCLRGILGGGGVIFCFRGRNAHQV